MLRRLVGLALGTAVAAGTLGGCTHILGLRTTIPAATGDLSAPKLDVVLVGFDGLATSIAPADPIVDSPNAVDVVPGSGNAIRVTWTGTACDGQTTLTMPRGGGVGYGIVVHSERVSPSSTCPSVRRQVIIGLSQFIPSTQFALQVQP